MRPISQGRTPGYAKMDDPLGMIVSSVNDDSAGIHSGLPRCIIGMKIMVVAGEDVSKFSANQLSQKLKGASRPLTIKFARVPQLPEQPWRPPVVQEPEPR